MDIAEKAVNVVKTYIDTQLKKLGEINQSFLMRLDAMEKSISEIKPEKGEKGDSGENGKDGRDGKDGESINPLDVFKYIDEKIEKEISKIPSAQDGLDGRDAIEIDILPSIVSEKTYGRDTYATHRGGLWKSVSQTSGMNGWQCLVDGISDISIDFDGQKTIKVKIEKSSGAIETKDYKFPFVIDKGVFKDGKTYEKGDGVTYGGSFWIAQKDAPEGKPGSSDDFRLAVKRGRDGKETVKLVKNEGGKI